MRASKMSGGGAGETGMKEEGGNKIKKTTLEKKLGRDGWTEDERLGEVGGL